MSVQLLGSFVSGPQMALPLFIEGQSAPDSSDQAESMDISQLCVRNGHTSLAVLNQSDAMTNIGIQPGDTLIVDRLTSPRQGNIILGRYQEELLVRILELKPSPRLLAANPAYPDIIIPEDAALDILGVVLHCVHSFRN